MRDLRQKTEHGICDTNHSLPRDGIYNYPVSYLRMVIRTSFRGEKDAGSREKKLALQTERGSSGSHLLSVCTAQIDKQEGETAPC